MELKILIDDVQFDAPNVRQTAIHVLTTNACDQSLSQEQVEEHLKDCALKVIRNGEHTKNQLINARGTQAFFVVEDLQGAIFSTDTPHRFEVNFFVRVGRRQEQ